MLNNTKQFKQAKLELANLREFIVRFTKVYEGVLPEIDELLGQLRSNLSGSATDDILAKLTGPVLQHADGLKQFSQEFNNRIETFSNQLLAFDSTSVDARQEINALVSEVHSNPFSIDYSLDYLERIFGLVSKALDNAMSSANTQLDDVDITAELHGKLMSEFKDLLALLVSAEPDDDSLKEVQQQFQKGLNRQELLECCLIVLRSLLNDVLNERKQAEKYIASLQKRLVNFNKNIDLSLSNSEESFKHKQENSASLRNQMEVIDDVVSNSDDIEQLKAQAGQILEKMSSTLSSREQSDKQEQLELMDLLAQMKSQLAALEKETDAYKQRLLEQKYHSHRDPLTQVANRNAYNERVELEYRRWKRHKHPISIAVVDIDHFKKINDSFGHAAGDKTLQVIAQSISKCLRATDFLARWGGEEFVVLFPQTSLGHLVKPLETIRKQIQQIPFKFKDKSVSITASIGATEFTPGDTIQTAFERADSALYKAKHEGRNRCSIQSGQ